MQFSKYFCDGPTKSVEAERILVNLEFKWVPEINRPRPEQRQLPRSILRSGGLVLLTKPAETVKVSLANY
jgi:hypothetical protein